MPFNGQVRITKKCLTSLPKIRGVKGEYYPCKPDVFEQTYEKVEDIPIWTSNEWWKGNGTITVPNGTGDLVPYHTICGCEVCGCTMGNKMVSPRLFHYPNTFNTNDK